MTKALFVTFDAGGTAAPMVGIAQRFAAGGGPALVLGVESNREAAARAGVPFEAFTVPPPFEAARATSPVPYLRQLTATLTSRAIAADVVALAERYRPDVVLVDCMLLSAISASVGAGLRTVTLVHSLPSYFAGRFARGPAGVVCGARGLRPRQVWGGVRSSIAVVMPEFDPGAHRTSFAGLRLVGPVLTDAPARGNRGRPRVLVSLSTVFYAGQDRTLARLAGVLGELDVDAVITTGRSIDPADLDLPPNVEAHRHLDHDTVLAGADLLVGHGGHGTTLRALAHGVPVLVLPSFGFSDQPQVGKVVARLGVGRTLPARSSAARLRGAVEDLAGPGSHRDAAAALADRIRSTDAVGDAVAVLVDVAARPRGGARRSG